MSQVTGLPDTKPEGALEVTKPLSVITLDLDAKEFTLVFAEGESITVPVRDVPVALIMHFEATAAIVAHLSENQLVWADPALVAAELAADAGV